MLAVKLTAKMHIRMPRILMQKVPPIPLASNVRWNYEGILNYWLLSGDAVDFDSDAARKSRDRNRRTCGSRVAEVFAVDVVDDLEVVHVDKEDRSFDDVVVTVAAGFEYGAEVAADLLRLDGNVAFDDV